MVGCGHVERWQRALRAVKEQFRLESLILPEQENTLREYSLKAQMCLSICQLVTGSPWFPVSSNHCRCTTHYKLFLAAKTKVFTNRKTKEHHAPVQRLTISRKTRWAKLDSFNPSLCRLSSFHLPYVKAMTLVRIPLQGLSVVQANCKVIFHTTTNYKSCLACQHFFQIRPITNCKRDKPIKNINICPCDSLNTMMCTNSQTLCTGGLEYLQRRLKNSILFFLFFVWGIFQFCQYPWGFCCFDFRLHLIILPLKYGVPHPPPPHPEASESTFKTTNVKTTITK